MKIALVYDAIYPYIKGGGEKRFYEIGIRLAKKGHQVHLYGMKFWEGANVIKKDEIYLHGICKAKKFYTKKGKRSVLQAIYFGFNSLKIIKEDFDVIDCCGFPYFSLFSCKLISLLKRKVLYSTWHEVWGLKYWREYIGAFSIFSYFIEKLSVLMPNIIISVSQSTARRIKDELGFKKKIYIIDIAYSSVHLLFLNCLTTLGPIIELNRSGHGFRSYFFINIPGWGILTIFLSIPFIISFFNSPYKYFFAHLS